MIDYSRLLNDKVQELKPSGIRRFFFFFYEMDHVISLSIDEPDFTIPWHVRQENLILLPPGTFVRKVSNLLEEDAPGIHQTKALLS